MAFETYPPHMLLSFGGVLGSDANAPEQWSCNVRLATFLAGSSGFPANFDETQQMAYLLRHITDVQNLISGSPPGLSSQVGLQWIKCNAIAPNGDYFNEGVTSEVQFATVRGPAGGLQNQPFQVSLVCSFRSDVQRGLGSHGRIYLPCPGVSYTTDGKISQDMQGTANALDTFLTALTEEDGTNDVVPSIVSGGNASKPGIARFITKVLVGDVADTQRRRRNDLVEVYDMAVVRP